jgi:hypothetical protein
MKGMVSLLDFTIVACVLITLLVINPPALQVYYTQVPQ